MKKMKIVKTPRMLIFFLAVLLTSSPIVQAETSQLMQHGVNVNYLENLSTLPSVVTQYKITGNADGSCSPTMVHLIRGKEALIILKAKTNKMFLLTSEELGLELMAMSNGAASGTITPEDTGSFPFTCGIHGAPEEQQTHGTFMIME